MCLAAVAAGLAGSYRYSSVYDGAFAQAHVSCFYRATWQSFAAFTLGSVGWDHVLAVWVYQEQGNEHEWC